MTDTLAACHGLRGVGCMAGYRCYLMSDAHIQGVQNIDGADDAEVMIKAAAILNSHVEHQGIEI